jgi:lipopolysaccharide/colanic/teichoic acid biosynthesis glycosyltransferase
MQVEILPSVPQAEKKQYLRVATIANKTALCYCYIGTDEDSVQFLTTNFHTGFTTENYESAKKLLRLQKEVDVIIIDVPFNESELRDFHSFLKNRELQNIPVIYNDCHMKHEAFLRASELVDDVIDLCNWQYDFSSKISFLRKSKEYSQSVEEKSPITFQANGFILKRVLDIVIASLLIIVLLPVFILIALAVKLTSKGPIFYNAKRAGRGFKIFKFYKFRTMEVNADKKIEALAHLNQYNDNTNGPKFFKLSNDPRITRVGKFLRNSSLDELPQLFNVLKGDMSLVGNRPLPLYEAATLTTNEFVERFMAPAGITGLWQIKKRGKSDMSTEERISLDISYARKSNLLYDFWIMAKTPAALLQKTDV